MFDNTAIKRCTPGRTEPAVSDPELCEGESKGASAPHEPASAASDFGNPVVDGGVVELVHTVVGEEILQRLLEESFIRSVAQGTLHERGGAISHVAGDHVSGQFRPPEVPQHGVHGMNQIQA